MKLEFGSLNVIIIILHCRHYFYLFCLITFMSIIMSPFAVKNLDGLETVKTHIPSGPGRLQSTGD